MSVHWAAGEPFLVDDEDDGFVATFGWRSNGHALQTKVYGRMVLLHRVLLDVPDGVLVDHANGNPMDNRKANLRAASYSQNAMNKRVRSDSGSGVKGVHWKASRGAWYARVTVGGKSYYSNYFKNIGDAANAYAALARKHHGEFARESCRS